VNYVVDASVVIQRLIRDTYTEQARRLFRNLTEADQCYLPEFGLLECTNVLWKQVRFHSMPQSDAEVLATDLLNLPFEIMPIEEVSVRALQIGLAHQLAVYDSIYIALAEKYNYPLITADTRQRRRWALRSSRSPISEAISYPE